MSADGSYYRLVYRGQPHGPGFQSKADGAAFVRWVEQRTGLEFSQQSADGLNMLHALWSKRKRSK